MKSKTLLIFLICVLATLNVVAEVGAFGSEGSLSNSSLPIILGVITEDPEPIGNLWTRIKPNRPHYVVLNEEGAANGDGPPDVIMDADNKHPIVVWAKNTGTEYRLVYSTIQNGQWIVPQFITAGSGADELDPKIIFDPAEQLYKLVYWTEGATPAVWLRTAPTDLSSWSAPVRVCELDEHASRPDLVIHEDVLYVVYEVDVQGTGSAPVNIVLTEETQNGFVPLVVAITQQPDDAFPKVYSFAGNFWVDWIDSDTEAAYVEQDNLTGAWGAVKTESYQSIEERDYHVRGRIKSLVIE